nr:immunoglobulin heavy chain junction region [Macaca mulatta]MOV88964.1 immunoglobulin heavy chain junction region [Macaca mulatta]MOV89234.1 immunoglobulin heavy chain junction region [Macaca mulatta]MOV89492.1 immunoglobulin heavy chain junction region [Macaca mulatta]MOV90209.1 immunoglobulin heavy chain junction region [Macaca mulatta]
CAKGVSRGTVATRGYYFDFW